MTQKTRSRTTRRSFFSHGMAKWGLFMGVLFAVWFGGWFAVAHWADGKIGDILTRLNDRNISVLCTDRDVRGFPFRLGVFCQEAGINDGVHDYSLKLGTLRSAAQIYAPRENVVEVDGPMSFASKGISLEATWELMRFFIDANKGGFDLLSSNFEALKGRLNDQGFNSSKGAVHIRPTPAAADRKEFRDLDLALDLKSVAVETTPGTNADILADLTLGRGYENIILKRRAFSDWLAEETTIDVRVLSLTTPEGARLALAGPLQLHNDGTISGTLKIGVENQEKLAQWVAEINPELGPTIAAIGQGIALAGSEQIIAGKKMTALDVTLTKGKASVGFISLGDIPPLRF